MHPITGFSGTKDSRNLLPRSVQHLDLEEQRHINALVFKHLLREENGVVLLPEREAGCTSDAEELLRVVIRQSLEVQVILDVGAQILELNNLQIAQRWLEMNQSANSENSKKQACVFFDGHDNLKVVNLRGTSDIFQTFPYAQQFD
ncbi:hypothetical protein MCOR07_004341 [Pyricularia oryzae]|nr:hypothetical protein MCOR19_006913 [Pyricularia oryzae]KAI6372012.1 hypothetical protein MCOR32_006011 [Pyricularia oryzae]KAI6404834.1 hypothetical protein MCOR24_007921 [Pyricularia oryzae]KAI6486608.1 hypothetical protein MCOR18_003378 [Pyricularia oryzae]KAI6622529.1 hypothetical protein MCOR07_004341 [Pyricularia oryzae]